MTLLLRFPPHEGAAPSGCRNPPRRGRVLKLQKCELHSIAHVFGAIAAQARTTPNEQTGFSFVHCKVTGTGPLYLGRAMGQYSRIVYAYSYFDDIVAGWDDWDQTSKEGTVFFGLYNCLWSGSSSCASDFMGSRIHTGAGPAIPGPKFHQWPALG